MNSSCRREQLRSIAFEFARMDQQKNAKWLSAEVVANHSAMGKKGKGCVCRALQVYLSKFPFKR